MDLRELRRHWELFGSTDPFWAVLTAPTKRHGRWETAEFFASGRAEVDLMLSLVDRVAARSGHRPRRGRALDFGCGVGRLTQALCRHFARCDGVDIASSMVTLARRYNAFGERCHYHLNTSGDLGLFPDGCFDFLYTAHVLQHMRPDYTRGYLREFLRVLAPGALAFCELVTEPVVGCTQPLPDDAFRASIVRLDVPDALTCGQRAIATVLVRNTSAQTWPAAGRDGWFQVTVGNHWNDPDGARVALDDARAALPADLPPGAEQAVELEVTAPDRPGIYQLEIDLVQEGVSWFADHGSPTALGRIRVRPPPAWQRIARLVRGGTARSRVRAVDGAVMEMHGVAEAEVSAWVRAAGGDLVAVLDWDEIWGARSYDWVRKVFLIAAPDRDRPRDL